MPPAAQFDTAEYFAGNMAITRAMRCSGLRGAAYDIDHANSMNEMDMIGIRGYIFAIMIACSVEMGGMGWFAP
eukprot:15435283-Alexandrium_andersonii.AAC.1